MAVAGAPRRRRPTFGRVLAGIATLGASEVFRAVSKIGEKKPTAMAAATLAPMVPRARAPVISKGAKSIRGTSTSSGISDTLSLEGIATDDDLETLKQFVEDELDKDQRVLDSLMRLARENAGDVEEVQDAVATLAETLTALQEAAEQTQAPAVRAAAAAPGGLFGGAGGGLSPILLLVLLGGLGTTGTGTGTGVLGGLDPLVLILLLGGLGGTGLGGNGGLGGILPLLLILTIV